MSQATNAPAMTIPAIVPPGWQIVRSEEGRMLFYQSPSGLRATFSIETYSAQDGPCELDGVFNRVVLSRKTMYPTWDEMRDFIRTCGLFDRTRDVFMVLPPDQEYVNLHPHAFHWWQQVLRSAP